jgi:hypothetical protein
MLNLQLISDKKPGARHNEDLFGFKGDTFWLLDGATSTDGPPLARDAYWLVHELDTALSALAARDLDVAAMAAAACTLVADRWPSTEMRRPVAALALWRIRDGKLTAAITGNVSLLVPTAAGTLELTDTRLPPSHIGAGKALLDALAAGASFESDAFQALRRDMKMQEAGAPDSHVHGWLASAAERRPGDFRQFSVDLAGLESPSAMLAATDGFMELRRYQGIGDSADFLGLLQVFPGGLPGALAELRAVERHPDSGRQFPRTKRHDDATAVLLALG